MVKLPPTISRRDAERRLGLSRVGVQRLLENGTLKGYRMGTRVRITTESVESQVKAAIKEMETPMRRKKRGEAEART